MASNDKKRGKKVGVVKSLGGELIANVYENSDVVTPGKGTDAKYFDILLALAEAMTVVPPEFNAAVGALMYIKQFPAASKYDIELLVPPDYGARGDVFTEQDMVG